MEYVLNKPAPARVQESDAARLTKKLAVSQARAAIADRYDALERRRYGPTLRIHWMAAQRIHVIERYLYHRYGRFVPDDDAGREDLMILANHVAQNPIDPRRKILGCIRAWAPRMVTAEAEAIADKVIEKPRRYKAATLGRLMRLTREEWVLLDAKTIRPFDKTDAEMAEERKQGSGVAGSQPRG